MLSGYMETSGLDGMGCGLDTSCGCERGMGSLNPVTWGPSDWLVAAAVSFAAWKLFTKTSERRYTKRVMRRFGVEE